VENRLVEMWTHLDDAVFECLEHNERLDVVGPVSVREPSPLLFLDEHLGIRSGRGAKLPVKKHCRKTRRGGEG
jgi:hypothetical protein